MAELWHGTLNVGCFTGNRCQSSNSPCEISNLSIKRCVHGFIATDGYPGSSYSNNQDIHWTLLTQGYNTMCIGFVDFEVTTGYIKCMMFNHTEYTQYNMDIIKFLTVVDKYVTQMDSRLFHNLDSVIMWLQWLNAVHFMAIGISSWNIHW